MQNSAKKQLKVLMNTKNGISAEISLIPGNERSSRLGPRLAISKKHSPVSELFSAHVGEAITSASHALLGEEGTEVELQISKCEQGSAATANTTTYCHQLEILFHVLHHCF